LPFISFLLPSKWFDKYYAENIIFDKVVEIMKMGSIFTGLKQSFLFPDEDAKMHVNLVSKLYGKLKNC
jgi:hypothetical protein